MPIHKVINQRICAKRSTNTHCDYNILPSTSVYICNIFAEEILHFFVLIIIILGIILDLHIFVRVQSIFFENAMHYHSINKKIKYENIYY